MDRWREYFSVGIVVLLLLCGCLQQNPSGKAANLKWPAASSQKPAREGEGNEVCSPERLSQLEQAMESKLAGFNTPFPFSFYVEGKTDSFNYDRGGSTMDTEYQSASTSKWITAAVILSAIDKGKINLTDHPQDYIGFWNNSINKTNSLFNITLAQLLSFTSGLAIENDCVNNPWGDFELCISKIAENNSDTDKTPGTEFWYRNTHLQVAGLMAVKALNQSNWSAVFSRFQEETDLLQNSKYDLPSETNPRLAGGMHWTANDYVGFIRALKEGQMLSPALRDMMLSDQIGDATISYSPLWRLHQNWHYGFGCWIECYSPIFNCPSVEMVSSPGAYGHYPYINLKKDFFGIVAIQDLEGNFSWGINIFNTVRPEVDAWAACQNIDAVHSYAELTNFNLDGLVTCPMGEGPKYKYLMITVRDEQGNPLPGVSSDYFTFQVENADALYCGELDLVFLPKDNLTNASGQIRFEIVGTTSIIGNVSIRASVFDAEIGDQLLLHAKSIDETLDCTVDISDFNLFAQDYRQSVWKSDFNWDGTVNMIDYVVFGMHWAHSAQGEMQIGPLPELESVG
ncbi:MAG: serine hydrolase [Nanoarchaeota archaeon]